MIAFDAHIYDIQYFGGLIRYWNNIFHQLIVRDFRFKLHYHKTPKYLPVWLKNYFVLSNQISDATLFHSTYYSLPFCNLKQILTVHDTIYEDYKDCFKSDNLYTDFMNRKIKCIEEADHIIAVSNFTKTRIIDLYKIPNNKITVIHHGINHLYDTEPDFKIIKSIKPYILYVGGRTNYKNFKLLLDVFFNQSFCIDFDLYVIGSENYYFQDEITVLNHFNGFGSVKLIGQVNDYQLTELYSNAELCVITSLIEGFGLASLEALKSVKKLVYSYIDVFKETCLDYPIYFNPYSETDLSDKIKIAISNNNLDLQAIEYASKFTWENTVNKMLELYRHHSG